MQNTATCSTPKPRAGIEGLDVYRVAVEFYRLLRQSTRGRRGHTRGAGHAIDQSYRAAESVVLNIAEAYPMSGADRARRFRIAGGEAAECHAGLDLLEIRGELRGPVLSQLRALLDAVSTSARKGKSALSYGINSPKVGSRVPLAPMRIR